MNAMLVASRDAAVIVEKLKSEQGQDTQMVKAVDVISNLLNEGCYTAVTTAAIYQSNIPARDELVDVIDLELDVYKSNDDYGSVEKAHLKERYFISRSENSKFCLHIGELIGKDPRAGFNTGELIGRIVQVEIKHNTPKNRTFANIESLRVIDVNRIKEEV